MEKSVHGLPICSHNIAFYGSFASLNLAVCHDASNAGRRKGKGLFCSMRALVLLTAVTCAVMICSQITSSTRHTVTALQNTHIPGMCATNCCKLGVLSILVKARLLASLQATKKCWKTTYPSFLMTSLATSTHPLSVIRPSKPSSATVHLVLVEMSPLQL